MHTLERFFSAEMRCDLNKIILLGAPPGEQLEIRTGLLRAGMKCDLFHIDKKSPALYRLIPTMIGYLDEGSYNADPISALCSSHVHYRWVKTILDRALSSSQTDLG